MPFVSRFVAVLGLLAALVPAVAWPGPLSAPLAPVTRAQQCYGQGDLGCVLQVLENTDVDRGQAAERWRLLALAAARLDRHDLARTAFAAWIALSESHRLDRATTLPAVWQDYQAVLLARYAKELDLTPQVAHTPQLPAPAATVVDLPRYGPPPKSNRDAAADFSLAIHGNAALHPARVAAPSFPGGGMAIDLHLSPRWRAGIVAEAVQVTVAARALDVEQAFRILDAQVRAGCQVAAKGYQTFDIIAGFGFAAVGTTTTAVGSAGLRYAWAPPQQVLGFFVALTGRALSDAPGFLPLGTLAVGISLRPVRSSGGG